MKMSQTKYRFLPYFLLFLSIIYSKDVNLESIELRSKTNGIIITAKMDSVLEKDNITAWQSNSGWFYITMYKTKGDTSNLKNSILSAGIIDYQVIQEEDSFQIGLRLKRDIEFHEFIFINKNTLSITLRYSTDYFSTLDSSKGAHLLNGKSGIPNGIKKWLYLTGSGMVIAGSIKNGRINSNIQTHIGMTMILTTYILNKIWRIK